MLVTDEFQIDEDLAKINVDDPKYQLKEQNGALVNGVGSCDLYTVMIPLRESERNLGMDFNQKPKWDAICVSY